MVPKVGRAGKRGLGAKARVDLVRAGKVTMPIIRCSDLGLMVMDG